MQYDDSLTHKKKKTLQPHQALEPQEHLAKVLQGNHAFLTWKYYIKAIILSKYTTKRGYTPIYTGRAEYINYGGYGWGFR